MENNANIAPHKRHNHRTKRSLCVKVWLSLEEKNQLMATANNESMSISGWIRKQIIDSGRK